MLMEYIATFLPMLPNICKIGNTSNDITELIFHLDHKDLDHREPILELIYSDDKEFTTVKTSFLGITINMIRNELFDDETNAESEIIDATPSIEMNIEIDEIKFTRMISVDNLFNIWKIVEANKYTLEEIIATFCEKLEMATLVDKITNEEQRIMFLEFISYYTFYTILHINFIDFCGMGYLEESIFLLPWYDISSISEYYSLV